MLLRVKVIIRTVSKEQYIHLNHQNIKITHIIIIIITLINLLLYLDQAKLKSTIMMQHKIKKTAPLVHIKNLLRIFSFITNKHLSYSKRKWKHIYHLYLWNINANRKYPSPWISISNFEKSWRLGLSRQTSMKLSMKTERLIDFKIMKLISKKIKLSVSIWQKTVVFMLYQSLKLLNTFQPAIMDWMVNISEINE